MLKFALSFASGKVRELSSVESYAAELKQDSSKPWLISYCLSSSYDETDETELNYELNCMDDSTKQKLSIMLNDLVKFGSIECNSEITNKEICAKLKPSRASPLVYYPTLPNIFEPNFELTSFLPILISDYKEIVQIVLSILPEIKELDENQFKVIKDYIV